MSTTRSGPRLRVLYNPRSKQIEILPVLWMMWILVNFYLKYCFVKGLDVYFMKDVRERNDLWCQLNAGFQSCMKEMKTLTTICCKTSAVARCTMAKYIFSRAIKANMTTTMVLNVINLLTPDIFDEVVCGDLMKTMNHLSSIPSYSYQVYLKSATM